MQERSMRRREAILVAAQDLLVTENPEDLAMREVARRADISIGSLYQYFPSKPAILRALVMRNLDKVGALLRGEVNALLEDHAGRPTIAQAVDRIIDAYVSHYRSHPEAIAVWAGAQADLELRRLDVIDTRATADFMVAPMMILLSSSDRDAILSVALLITELAGHAVRLALALEAPLTDRIVAQFKTMVTAVLEANRESN
jgi:AcrR family transcriptional regulator